MNLKCKERFKILLGLFQLLLIESIDELNGFNSFNLIFAYTIIEIKNLNVNLFYVGTHHTKSQSFKINIKTS